MIIYLWGGITNNRQTVAFAGVFRDYIPIQGGFNHGKYYKEKVFVYITLEALIAILSLLAVAFKTGYQLGKDKSKKHKK